MFEHKKLISIIILNYNGKELSKECIDSVLWSDYPNFEIVVIDNASVGNDYQLLKDIYRGNEKVRIFKSDKQLYFTGGCNLGAKKSRGENLIFLNNDTIVDKHWIQELIAFTHNKEKYLVQPKILSYWQKNIIDNVGGKYVFPGIGLGAGHGKKDTNQYNKNKCIDYASGTCFMVNKDFFEELNSFDKWYKYHYEDVDLSLRAKKQGGKSWYCCKSIIYHKGSITFKKNVSNKNLIYHIRKNRIRTIIKNFNGWEKYIRIACLLLIYIVLSIKELLSLKPAISFLTIKAAIFALTYHDT